MLSIEKNVTTHHKYIKIYTKCKQGITIKRKRNAIAIF